MGKALGVSLAIVVSGEGTGGVEAVVEAGALEIEEVLEAVL